MAYKPKHYFTLAIADIDIADSYWMPIPVAGTITKIMAVAGPGGAAPTVDNNMTFEIAGVEITGSAIVQATAGNAEGDVDVSYPTALNIVAANSALEVISDGAAAASAVSIITVEVTAA